MIALLIIAGVLLAVVAWTVIDEVRFFRKQYGVWPRLKNGRLV